MARDKVNLDIFWLRDESLEETASLPEPDVLAEQIIEDLHEIVAELQGVLNGLSDWGEIAG